MIPAQVMGTSSVLRSCSHGGIALTCQSKRFPLLPPGTSTGVTLGWMDWAASACCSAASMLAAEQQALAAQSIQPKVTPVEVPGGSSGNRLDWQVKAIPPWLQDRKTDEVPITCAGIIVDGPGGDSYGVYVFADPKIPESQNRMSSVLASVAVNAS